MYHRERPNFEIIFHKKARGASISVITVIFLSTFQDLTEPFYLTP